jgi:hypothetical protein
MQSIRLPSYLLYDFYRDTYLPMPFKRSNRKNGSGSDTAYRCLGAFCGAILGMCIASIVSWAIGVESIPVAILALAGGLVVGALAGYRVPMISDALYWITTLFT